MAVIYKGDVNQGISITDSGRTASRILIFYCENGESINAVRSHTAFPKIGEAYPEDNDMRCSSISVKPSGDGIRNKYQVATTYSVTKALTAGDCMTNSKTLFDEPFNVSMSAIENVVPFHFSYDVINNKNEPLNPVVTSAGTEIPANTVKVSLQISFSYYLRYFSPSWILNLTDTVNQGSVKVCGIEIAPECGLIKNLSANIVKLGDLSVFQTNVQMEVNSDGFLRRLPDKGFYCKGINGNPMRIYTAITTAGVSTYGSDLFVEGKASAGSHILPVDEPLWLDGSGNIQTKQSGPQWSPVFLKFREKRVCSWSCLSLPQNIGRNV